MLKNISKWLCICILCLQSSIVIAVAQPTAKPPVSDNLRFFNMIKTFYLPHDFFYEYTFNFETHNDTKFQLRGIGYLPKVKPEPADGADVSRISAANVNDFISISYTRVFHLQPTLFTENERQAYFYGKAKLSLYDLYTKKPHRSLQAFKKLGLLTFLITEDTSVLTTLNQTLRQLQKPRDVYVYGEVLTDLEPQELNFVITTFRPSSIATKDKSALIKAIHSLIHAQNYTQITDEVRRHWPHHTIYTTNGGNIQLEAFLEQFSAFETTYTYPLQTTKRTPCPILRDAAALHEMLPFYNKLFSSFRNLSLTTDYQYYMFSRAYRQLLIHFGQVISQYYESVALAKQYPSQYLSQQQQLKKLVLEYLQTLKVLQPLHKKTTEIVAMVKKRSRVLQPYFRIINSVYVESCQASAQQCNVTKYSTTYNSKTKQLVIYSTAPCNKKQALAQVLENSKRQFQQRISLSTKKAAQQMSPLDLEYASLYLPSLATKEQEFRRYLPEIIFQMK